MKNTTNLLILNLAVADLLFILVCVPATASDYVLMYWPFGLAWCRQGLLLGHRPLRVAEAEIELNLCPTYQSQIIAENYQFIRYE